MFAEGLIECKSQTLTTLTICRRPSKLNHSFPRPGSLHLESTLRTVHPPQPPPRTRGAGYRPQAICTVACYVMLCKRRHVSGIFLASVCSFFCFGAFRLRLEVDTTRSFQKSRKISAVLSFDAVCFARIHVGHSFSGQMRLSYSRLEHCLATLGCRILQYG